MSSTGEALIHHLRADVELKAEVIKALRAQLEQQNESARARVTLIANVSNDLLELATNVGLLCSEDSSIAAQRTAEKLKAVCEDLVDYTAAVNGQLVLSRKPVNIGRLLSRIATRHVVDVRVAPEVPERIVTDEAQFARLLGYFVEQESRGAVPEARLLEVTMLRSAAPAIEASDDDATEALPRMLFLLRRGSAENDDTDDSLLEEHPTPSFARVRTALAASLCELMDAELDGVRLTIPVQGASDQAHTGIFRLADSERVARDASLGTSAPVATTISPPDDAPDAPAVVDGQRDDDSVDLLYLDRQLGSLAPVILARTAPAFLLDAQRRMTDLHVAHECQDLSRMEHIARAWKGSALSVGARSLATLLDSIEKQAAGRHVPGAGSIWQVRSALDRVLRTLESQARNGRRTR